MQSLEMLKPAVKPEFDDYRYYIGRPRSYKFNGSKGTFEHGETKLADHQTGFVFLPLGYQAFKGKILGGQKVRKYVEFFFANNAGDICHILFAGLSADSFADFAADSLFYEGKEITQVFLRVTAEKKETKNDQGEKITYFIARFKIESELGEEWPPVPVNLYRESTMRGEQISILESVNVTLPELPPAEIGESEGD